MSAAHLPVLLDEVVGLLCPPERSEPLVVDGTLGLGGHSEALLEAGARVVGIDRDPEALARARSRLARFGDRFQAVEGNFRDVAALLASVGIEAVDGALVDVGVSSMQLDTGERGFSFRLPGPLDMRMGPDAEPLATWLEKVDEAELARVIATYGEERFAKRVARAILRDAPFADTVELAETVSAAIPRKAWPPHGIHPATRTFQALRIAVNDELGALEDWLAALPRILAPGGRAVAIAFHSLEDRMIKRAFAQLSQPCTCPPDLPVCACGAVPWRLLTKRPLTAGEAELSRNPRARSAKLRAVERVQ